MQTLPSLHTQKAKKEKEMFCFHMSECDMNILPLFPKKQGGGGGEKKYPPPFFFLLNHFFCHPHPHYITALEGNDYYGSTSFQ